MLPAKAVGWELEGQELNDRETLEGGKPLKLYKPVGRDGCAFPPPEGL